MKAVNGIELNDSEILLIEDFFNLLRDIKFIDESRDYYTIFTALHDEWYCNNYHLPRIVNLPQGEN